MTVREFKALWSKVPQQHDDHVTTWLIWRMSRTGMTAWVDADGTRTYLNPEDVYIRD